MPYLFEFVFGQNVTELNPAPCARSPDIHPRLAASLMMALLASSAVSFALSLAVARPVRPVSRVHRSGGGIVALDTEPPAAYETTPGGLLLKSVRSVRSGELPEPGQIVTVKYSTTLLSNGQVFDNIPEISFVLGTVRKQDPGRQFAWGAPSRTLDALPLLQEAMVGMRVGDARRVSVTPSSEFALLPGVTVQLELELVEIKTGRNAERPVDSAFLAAPSWQCHSSLTWPPGAYSPGPVAEPLTC